VAGSVKWGREGQRGRVLRAKKRVRPGHDAGDDDARYPLPKDFGGNVFVSAGFGRGLPAVTLGGRRSISF
jgi:hypothetical protein